MRTLSASLQTKIDNGAIPEITATLNPSTGSALLLTGGDFMADTVDFTSATTQEGSFDIGSVIIGTFGFALNNFDGKFDSVNFTGATITPVLDYGGGDTLSMGRYYISKHNSIGKAIRCDSYDAMKLFDEVLVTINASTTVPTALDNIVNAVNTAKGTSITLIAPNLPNVSITEKVTGTARLLLAYIASFIGRFAIMRQDGLHVEWYGTSVNHIDTVFTTQHLSTDDTVITGVYVYPFGADSTGGVLSGSAGYVIPVQNNPLITADNAQATATRIAANVVGMSFRQGNVDVLSNPAFEAGDKVTLEDLNGDTVTMYHTTLTYNVHLRQRLQCDAIPQEETDLRQDTSLTGDELVRILSVTGINADWINAGTISVLGNLNGTGYRYVIQNDGAYILNPNDEVIAKYAETARIGKETSVNVLISGNAISMVAPEKKLVEIVQTGRTIEDGYNSGAMSPQWTLASGKTVDYAERIIVSQTYPFSVYGTVSGTSVSIQTFTGYGTYSFGTKATLTIQDSGFYFKNTSNSAITLSFYPEYYHVHDMGTFSFGDGLEVGWQGDMKLGYNPIDSIADSDISYYLAMLGWDDDLIEQW